VTLDWDAAQTKVLTVYFNMSTAYESWDVTIGLIASGKVQVDPLVTHKFPLTRWEEAFAAVEKMEALKALLIP